MSEIGCLSETDGQYEFRDPSRSLIIRGEHPEWVLMAAAEVIGNTARLEAESVVEELNAMVEFEAVEPIEVDSAKYAMKERFELIPQCIVTLGKMDYKWAAPEGRAKKQDEFGSQTLKRVHDMSLTRSDTFLSNEDGVDTTNETTV
ncbi:hypothetical protein [Cognatiyoonia sp. IB215182]|uniref:hypothetical protein n=1 Tax=Cognatiyoonia sp. IB215182 TaxID=3097353 RepID=UPI002A0AF457|nr:hypothetical protein [Cognatiyoonia sp. IB215182]MDX8355840.1 hypothetical protein [Cognatiyoonia sp. IB215182]